MSTTATVTTQSEVASSATPWREEAQSLTLAIESLDLQAKSLGVRAKEELAVSLGMSANKHGRPAANAFLAFVIATRQVGFAEMQRLAKIANKAHAPGSDGRKDVIRVTITTDLFGNEQAKITVNRPVDLEGKF